MKQTKFIIALSFAAFLFTSLFYCVEASKFNPHSSHKKGTYVLYNVAYGSDTVEVTDYYNTGAIVTLFDCKAHGDRTHQAVVTERL